jgi:hypothetical protein
MPRILDNKNTFAFWFNMSSEANKLIGLIAVLFAAGSHAFGGSLVDTALDIVVACILFGAVQALIWAVLRFGLGVEIKTGFPRSS